MIQNNNITMITYTKKSKLIIVWPSNAYISRKLKLSNKMHMTNWLFALLVY